MDNSEFELSFDKLYKTYNEKITETIESIEKVRLKWLPKQIARNVVIAIGLIFFIMFPFIIFLSNNNPSIVMLYIPILIALNLIAYVLYYEINFNTGFKTILKKRAMPYVMEAFENIKWHKKGELPFKNQELGNSGLFMNFCQQCIYDQFSGTYKDVPFIISEVKLSNDRQDAFDVFKGVIISFKYNKRIKNRTIIATKRDFTKKQDFLYSIVTSVVSCIVIFIIGHPLDKLIAIVIAIIIIIISWITTKKEEPLNKVILEDPKFNKRFNVYSSDQVEARYLVTPLFMELLNNLKTAFGVNKLKCSFCGKNLIIAISTKKDLFEIGDLYTPCNNPKHLLNFYRKLTSIYKLIEYFKLDEKKYPAQ